MKGLVLSGCGLGLVCNTVLTGVSPVVCNVSYFEYASLFSVSNSLHSFITSHFPQPVNISVLQINVVFQ